MAYDFHDLIKSLNIFSQSTDDFYYLFDYEKKTFYFSDNIKEANNALASLDTTLSAEKWQTIIDPRDVKRLNTILNKIKHKRIDRFNFNFRIIGDNNQSSWLNNKGKLYCHKDQHIEYILGRLSNYVPYTQSTNHHLKKLKHDLNKMFLSSIPGYLVIFGIDDLKTINLKNGRAFGDGIISQVNYTIKKITHHDYSIYRINGDCFALVLTHYISQKVKQMYRYIQQELINQCTISAGAVSLTDYHIANCDILIQYAEVALDRAKINGKNQLCFFNPENYERKLAELELIEDIMTSIKNNFQGFELYYQPQYYSETFQLYGAEALLRYFTNKGQSIPAPQLIDLLEQNDLIYQVGLWVFKEALKTCQRLRKICPHFHISVNMSCNQLLHDSIEYDVIDIIQNSGVPGDAITIEITESLELANYPHLNNLFKSWKKYGIEISIDDFGTGYSSLSRLKEMSIDEIKIDRSFITEIQNNIYNHRLLTNIIDLANSSQIRVCCEGVETYLELKIIDDLHPTLFQGFLLGKPCDETHFKNNHIFIDETYQQNIMTHLIGINNTKMPTTNHSDEVAQTILNAENDIFYLSDLDTYELYYLNPAGQKMFNAKNYKGKKCYEVLHGHDRPCWFCTNRHLRQDSFYVWENNNKFCGRHFLLKDKLVSYQGKKVRLEVALDITDQEYISQSAKERLSFANKVVGYVNTLSKYSNYKEAVNKVLASIGDFYQADRAYLFERDQTHNDHWNNTFEWCDTNIEPQIDHLQNVAPQVVKRWLLQFEQDETIFIYNIAPLKQIAPEEWRTLHKQGIQRIIAVPIRENDQTIGFIGVDNPRYCIHDDSQIRVLASFLLTRIRQDRNEYRYRLLLNENNQDLLQSLKVGFWLLQINKKDNHHILIFDHILKSILDIPDNLDKYQNYDYWISKLNNQDHLFKNDLETMKETGELIQIECLWNGKIAIRLSGLMVENNESYTKFKGFCRIIE